MKTKTLFAALIAFCAAPLLPHAAHAQAIPAKPAAPASFTAREVNNFIKSFDKYVDQYIAAARAAGGTGDTSALDELANTRGEEIQQLGEAIAGKLTAAEIPRFSAYTEKQAARMVAASTAAFTAAADRERKTAQAAAASAASTAPTASSGGAYASAEVNAFVAKFDPYVEEYLRLAGQAAKTGDISKFKAFDDSAESKSLKATANSLSEALFDDQNDGPRFRSYLNDKLRSMFTANREARQAAALAAQPVAPAPSAPAPAPAPVAELSIPKTFDTPAFKDPNLAAYVVEYEAYLEDYIARANAVLHGADRQAFFDASKKESTENDKKRNAAIKKVSMEEYRLFEAYYQKQSRRQMDAYRAVSRMPDKKKPGAGSAFSISANTTGSVDLGSGSTPPDITQADRDKAQAQLAALLGGASSGPVTIPPKPARPIISSSGEANTIFKEVDAAIEEIITTLAKEGIGAAATFESSGFQQRMEGLAERAERLKDTLNDADKAKASAYMEKQNERIGAVIRQMLGGFAQNPDVQNAVAARMRDMPTEQDMTQVAAALQSWQASAGSTARPALPVFADAEINKLVRNYDAFFEEYLAAMKAMQKGDNSKMEAVAKREAELKKTMNDKTLMRKMSAEEQKRFTDYAAAQARRMIAELTAAQQQRQ